MAKLPSSHVFLFGKKKNPTQSYTIFFYFEFANVPVSAE